MKESDDANQVSLGFGQGIQFKLSIIVFWKQIAANSLGLLSDSFLESILMLC